MKPILLYLKLFIIECNKKVLACCSVLISLLIYFNYQLKIEKQFTGSVSTAAESFLYHFILFALAFTIPWLFFLLIEKKNYFNHKLFVFSLVAAAIVFALKVSLSIHLHFTDNLKLNQYYNIIIAWPSRLMITALLLYVIYMVNRENGSFYGINTKQFSPGPYLILLLLMIPFIAVASTQHDFLQVYPKLKMIELTIRDQPHNWMYKLLFELSYGSDFFTIELFFRGFLICGFIKWAGKQAILPMAVFYCVIHFGKPLGECISSYFGGMILGVVVFHTRSIFGGFMVHLGIAWLMEIGGYIGNHT